MTVRYNPALGIVSLVVGGLSVLLGIWLLLLGEFTPTVLIGPLLLVLGVLYLVRPYFSVHQGMVQVPAPIGPVKRRFPFRALELDGGKLVAVREDQTRKKLPVARWMAHSADWAAVVAQIPPTGTHPR